MMRRNLLTLGCSLLALMIGAGAVQATTPINTLERIKTTGVLRIGYGDAAPFSYIDEQSNEVIGYSIEICQRLAELLQVQLNLPSLDISFVLRTPSNRIMLLNSGEIDIECNASTNTPERRQSAQFSLSHFFVSVRYVALQKNNLKTLQDLAGRSVSVSRGTVNVGQISQANREQQLNLSIVPVDSFQQAFKLVSDGRVAAFAMDDILLSSLIAASDHPERYSLSEEIVAPMEPLGFMMRLGDDAFAEQVNKALEQIYTSPDMPLLYQRWFQQPLPGKGITLNVPMSDVLAEHFISPR